MALVGDPGEGRRLGGRLVRRLPLLLPALAVASLLAQPAPTGSIEGKLTDLYSNPLDGAQVVLRNLRTGSEFVTVTARNGAWRLAGLTPGDYALETHSAKRGSGRASGIVVIAGHASRVQTAVALKDQSIAAWMAARTTWVGTPTVAPFPAALRTESARAGVLESAMHGAGPAKALLLAGAASLRNALVMPALTPHTIEQEQNRPEPAEAAVTNSVSSEEFSELPLNGLELFAPSRTTVSPRTGNEDDSSGVLRQGHSAGLDRSERRMAFEGSNASNREESALLAPRSNEAAVGSLRLDDRGWSSEIARAEIRSGADALSAGLHGQTFFFNRSSLLGARNPFTEWTKETAPATGNFLPVFSQIPWTPTDRRSRWGASLGGPVGHDVLYWFGGFERLQRNDPAVSTARHPDNLFGRPTDDELHVLAARLDLSSTDPVGEGLQAYSGMLETLAGLLGPALRTSAETSAFARIDWKATEKHRFTVEATGAQWDSPGGGLTQASEAYGNHSFGRSRGSETWLLARWNALLTPNLLAVSQAAFGRHILAHEGETPSVFEQKLNVNPWGQLPQVVVDSRYGFSIGNPAQFGSGSHPDEHSYEGRSTLEWMRGTLGVRAGFGFRYDQDATSFLRNHTGTYHYARVENFISDALSFAAFGLPNAVGQPGTHNCDQRGKAWRDSDGILHGIGFLPCYSWYTQTVGPTNWHLETSDLLGFIAAQWQPRHNLVLTAGLAWEHVMAPPPIGLVNNPDLPMAGRVPALGNQWSPHASVAWGARESHLPVLRLGYGMFYGRTPNSIFEAALTATGSAKGNLNLFFRPTDNLPGETGGAPVFPWVPAGDPKSAAMPGAVEIQPGFRNPEVHQAVATVEEELPGRVLLSVSALTALGRRLPVTVDTNFDPALNPGTITYEVVDAPDKGPIKTPQITVPFFASLLTNAGSTGRLNPKYQQITDLVSRANSTYEAAALHLSRAGRRGLSFNAHYIYSHAMDWNPDEGALRERASIFDPLDFRQEYGTSNLDVRHSASMYALWRAPWKLRGAAGVAANGWLLSGIGQYHSGLPYTMRTAGSLAEEFESGGIVLALGPGMNGYGGANRVYGVGRNTFRYPATWKADMRVGKSFALGHERELELLAQSFNLFNHQNVTELETVGYSIEPGTTTGSLPRLSFLTGLKPRQVEFGQPLNINGAEGYRERTFEFGIRVRFKRDFAE